MSNPTRAESRALTRTAEPPAEVHSLTADQRRTVSEAAALWQAEWSSLEKMKPQDLETVARLIVTAFPTFTPLELTKYFYVLGGKVYDNAEFWMHQAAQHPDYLGCELEAIEPGTPDWNACLGQFQDPAVIAAAVKCTARRRVGDAERVEVESSYVLRADSILADYTYRDLAASSRGDAEREAKALGPVDRVFFQKHQNNQPGGKWVARIAVPKPDAIALANKKARSTATRRCLRRLFSLEEARATSTLAAANYFLEQRAQVRLRAEAPAVEIPGVGQIRGAGPEVKRIPDRTHEYGEPVDRRAAEDAAVIRAGLEPEQVFADADERQPLKAESHHDEAADRAPKLIREEDRRKLYLDLDKRDFSKYTDLGAHEALHALIAEMKGLPPGAPASTKDLTYPEWEELRKRIDALPLMPDTQGSDGGAA